MHFFESMTSLLNTASIVVLAVTVLVTAYNLYKRRPAREVAVIFVVGMSIVLAAQIARFLLLNEFKTAAVIVTEVTHYVA